jgi:hypothetical protein
MYRRTAIVVTVQRDGPAGEAVTTIDGRKPNK